MKNIEENIFFFLKFTVSKEVKQYISTASSQRKKQATKERVIGQ